MKVHKGIFPAAGLGTRFLPATKAQPKEMLPLVDEPTIRYVVEEAALRRLRERRPMYALAFEGKRYDTGDKLGFLKATVEFALARPDLADEFRAYLKSLAL